ncbi:MAG TPA: helix-turn-helix domain-containing protein [Solirubrobacteraceae bacterium]|nr:helix-turn-helix domain-containing protein [Solirubrobacteraceae bacterium]
MDRETLKKMLGDGLSLAEIGRRVGRHESTVAYWAKKHGLTAANVEQHRARGAIEREELRRFVEAGLSITQIAERVGRSKATVRHWLRRYDLVTQRSRGRNTAESLAGARAAGLERAVLSCRHHGEVEFAMDSRGCYRCVRCASAAVTRRRRRVRALLVEEAGGACQICGYDRCRRALHFHHVEPLDKRWEINARGAAFAIERLRAEATKCVLLCSNCHMEVEDGLADVSDLLRPA